MLPNLFVSPRLDLEPDALVIHMRSGDVMRTTRGVKYWQPPLAYYKYIVETFHPTSPIYICTEIHEPADGTYARLYACPSHTPPLLVNLFAGLVIAARKCTNMSGCCHVVATAACPHAHCRV